MCFGTVNEAMTMEQPEGMASLVWVNLIAKYKPKTSALKIELKQEFTKSKLESADTNPDEWLADLE